MNLVIALALALPSAPCECERTGVCDCKPCRCELYSLDYLAAKRRAQRLRRPLVIWVGIAPERIGGVVHFRMRRHPEVKVAGVVVLLPRGRVFVRVLLPAGCGAAKVRAACFPRARPKVRPRAPWMRPVPRRGC